MNPTRTIAVLALGWLTGCGNPVTFHDDLDFVWDFGFLLAAPDTVNTPYVQGARVRLTASARRDVAGWTMESQDEGVFRLDEGGTDLDLEDVFTNATAVGPGVTEVVVYDDRGRDRDRVEIEVRAPDRVELHAAGARFARLDDGASLTDSPQVLVDGLATFQVEYYAGARRLYGNGVLAVSPGADVEAETETTFLFENREWVRFTPRALGPQAVTLTADGVDVGTTTVLGVAADAVTRVEIVGTSERGADEGDSMVLLAQAFDASGVPIYGIDYAWDRDGAVEPGMGDLYRYSYDETARTELSATFDDDSATVTVHGDGWVDSSNHLGCDHAGGVGAWWALLPLLGLRRRR